MARLRVVEISLVLLVLFCKFPWICDAADLLDAKAFSQALSKLVTEGLGVADLQIEFDRLQFNEEKVNGTSVILSLTADIANKFKDRLNVVRKLKKAVEDSYGRSPSYLRQWECCKSKDIYDNLGYDSRFRQRVDPEKACVKVSGIAQSSRRYLDNIFVNEMRKMLNDHPFIKWQYFGSEEGMLTIFPAFEDKAACSSYDPRFRPWYVETTTPEPKDVVLVIDTSGSMRNTLLNVAKEAAAAVLSTLNPRDRVGLVSFSTFASTPGNYDKDGKTCFSKRLADATPFNIKYLKGYVDNLKAQGVTNYIYAFEAAFRLLKTSYSGQGSTRIMVIMFLTDGAPSDDKTSIMQTIKDKNAELHNKVVIMTYGMLVNDKILLDIAIQDGTSYGVSKSHGVTAGSFTTVSDTDNLLSVMATYYDFFSKNTEPNKPIISSPYVDVAGFDLMTTAALPCYYNNTFIGVVATDISMEDIQSQITYFRKGRSSYAFMVDSFGRAMIHPLLPAPSEAFEDPIFMDIAALEPASGFGDVLASILRGEDGQKTFVSKQFLAHGGKVTEGVSVVELNSTYYWKFVPETSFAIGVVVPVGDTDETVAEQFLAQKLLYHRLDLVKPANPCVHFSRYASAGTVVKFSPEAFTDPFNYLDLNETTSSVNAYHAYMTRKRAPNPGFKPGIRDTVAATGIVQDFWFGGSQEYANYLIWRYIGTENGVFRITPGILLAKSFDPRKRPWYLKAKSNTGLVALTTPYMDAGGAGVVVTAAHTLYYGKANHAHTTNDQVIGVIGADFPIQYFYRLMTETNSKCNESDKSCLVLDKAGFVIMHDDFLSPDITAKALEYVHITEKEKDIAEDLIHRGYMVRKQCRNFEQLKVETFYEIQLPRRGVNTLHTGLRCKKYQLSQLNGTNVFLGIKLQDRNCTSKSCTCSSDGKCSTKQDLTCQCPCSSGLDFHYCRNEFPVSRIPNCPVSGTVKSTKQVNDPSTAGLEKCFDPSCHTKPDWESCYGVVGCSWCVKDKNNVPLVKKYCADIDTCYGGKERNVSAKTDQPSEKEKAKGGLSGGAIAGIVIGSIVAIAVAVCTAILWWKHRDSSSAFIPYESAKVHPSAPYESADVHPSAPPMNPYFVDKLN
ncbi:hypothetical protein ACROYT_G034402 [Oculina patagonica]